jgi:hypothetical protein
MNIKKVRRDDVDWIHLAEDGDLAGYFELSDEPPISVKQIIVLTSWETLSFSIMSVARMKPVTVNCTTARAESN